MTALHLQVPVGGRPGSDARSVVELARRAESAGFDGVVVVDHIVMGEHPEQYPLGTFTFPPDSAWIDPIVTLAAIAAVTSDLELTTSVLVAPVRSPGVLAKEIATLVELAGDRVLLGVGTGWQSEEYTAARLDFADRGRLLDDTMIACRALWSDSPASVDRPTIAFERLWCEPRPANPPPVLLGGQLHPRNVRRIVEWADGWMPHPMSPEDVIRDGVAGLRSAMAAAGRDPASLRVHVFRAAVRPDGTSDLDAILGRLDQYEAMGVTSIAVPLASVVDGHDWDTSFERIATRLAELDR